MNNPSRENIVRIMDGMRTKLSVVNGALLDPEDYSLEDYDDLLYLYEMTLKRQNLSISEMEGIVSELGSLRKKHIDRK